MTWCFALSLQAPFTTSCGILTLTCYILLLQAHSISFISFCESCDIGKTIATWTGIISSDSLSTDSQHSIARIGHRGIGNADVVRQHVEQPSENAPMQGMEERDSLLGALVHIKDLIANDSQLFALYRGLQGPPPCRYQNVLGLHRTQITSMGVSRPPSLWLSKCVWSAQDANKLKCEKHCRGCRSSIYRRMQSEVQGRSCSAPRPLVAVTVYLVW